MGRAGSPNTKGSSEITIFHSFARSNYFVQLKYRFSPLSPRPSRVCLLQCRPLSPVLPPPCASFALFPRSTLPRHPPYGSIDRAQSSVILPLLTLAHPVVQPPLSLPRSPFRPSPFHPPHPFLCLSFFVSSLSLSIVRFSSPLSASASTPFRSNIQLLATRTFANRSRKAGNEVAYGFCVHKCTVRFTALPPSNGATKKREIKVYIRGASGRKKERTGGKGCESREEGATARFLAEI